MAEFHHGITGRETASGKIPIRNAATAVIAMLAFADDADEETFPLNTPVLVTSINRVLPKAGTTGNLRKNLEIISQITSPTLVVIRIDDPQGDGLDQSLVIGTTEETGQRTGLQALLTVKSVLGLTPKIICVPDVETIDIANAIGAICKKLRAYSYITPRNRDGVILETAYAVVNFRNMLAFREVELIWPEWTSGNVFLGSESQNDAMSAGISPDLQYSDEESENEIYWAIEVNGTLFPTEIGNGEYSYLEDYLQENKETLGITGEYKSESDEGENDSSVYIYNITNTRKFVRLIPDKPYKSEMKLIGNPTAKIDSDGIISFWLEANNEVQIPDPEPEVCNCESSWILIPELTPSVKIGAYDEFVLAIENHVQNTDLSYSAGKPVIDLLKNTLTYNSFVNHLELIRCDSEGALLRNKTNACLTISMWTLVKNSDGIKEPIRYLTSKDLCAYDANEVIPDSGEIPCTPTVIPINNNPMGVDNLVFKYSINGGEVKSHTQNTDSSAKIHTVLVNILFYSNAILFSYGMGNFYSSVAKNYFINYDYPIQGAPSGNGEPMTVEFWATPDVDNCLVTKAFGGDFVLHSCGKIVWTEDKIKYPNVL